MTQLKRIRTQKNLSQKELAELSCRNVRMIQHYEQGTKNINNAAVITALALAKALNVNIENILEEERTGV